MLGARDVSWNAPRNEAGNVPSWIAPRGPETPNEIETPPPPRLPEIDLIVVPDAPPPRIIEAEIAAMAEEAATLRDEIARLRSSLANAAAELVNVRTEILRESEDELVHLAVVVAERVVLRTIGEHAEIARDWAREGIAALGQRSPRTITISNDLAEAFSPESLAAFGASLEIDSALAPATCIVRSADARVNVSASARVRAIVEAMSAR